MMPVHTLSGCGLEKFLVEARGSGWTILGTVGSERVKGREGARESTEGGWSEDGENETTSAKKKPPVIDCHHYSAEGPTIVVLGKAHLILKLQLYTV